MTFADLMSLLFALFALLLSFVDLDLGKFDKNASQINEAFNNPNEGGAQSINLDELQQPELDLQNREGALAQK